MGKNSRSGVLVAVLAVAAAAVLAPAGLTGVRAADVSADAWRAERLAHMDQERAASFVQTASGATVKSDAKIQKMLLDLMAALDAFEYKYWLVWGSLLGVVRDKGIIPGDHDADLGMMKAHFDYLIADKKLAARLKKEGYVLTQSKQNVMKLYQTSELDDNGETDYASAYCDKCTNIDIFPFEEQDGCLMRDCFYPDWKQPCQSRYCVESSIPTSYHTKTVQLWVKKFNRYVPIPNNPKAWLQYYYRDWWVPHKDGTKGSKSRLPGCAGGKPAVALDDAPLAA
eukprot:NODE_2472_length_1057_cov_53.454839_g2454_i0.p2 GENE.NODE_2472_length_1057_cov_53.454839_g2454_i0~~NODE_2472_length_1057_cov_53.454839_g2454_i0.p2  ORF type:complete len:303 (+),score=108.02 NODE_2472_length_1057_cov_53.454839_g2454_i0:62-910(+)